MRHGKRVGLSREKFRKFFLYRLVVNSIHRIVLVRGSFSTFLFENRVVVFEEVGRMGRVEKITIYEVWGENFFERYFLDREGKKVVLERGEGERPFELVRFGTEPWKREE